MYFVTTTSLMDFYSFIANMFCLALYFVSKDNHFKRHSGLNGVGENMPVVPYSLQS